MIKMVAVAIYAGVLSWSFLKRYTIDGDYSLAVFVAAFMTLYLSIRGTDEDQAFVQTLKVSTAYIVSLATSTVLYRLSPFHPLAAYPGPFLWRMSSLFLTRVSLGGHRHLIIDRMHQRYGRVVRIGPNALSVNSSSAFNIIYGGVHHMMKSDSYKMPGRVKGIALFFQQTRQDHMDRKNIWLRAFTASALENFFPPLERSVWELTECIDKRTKSDGTVDLMECLCHWSYDFMGKMVFGGSGGLNLMQNGDPRGLVLGGKKATAIQDSFGQAPWLLDILWHIPGSRSVHYLREVAASLMRTRVKASDVKIRDLTSYLLEGDPRTGKQISLSDLELDAIIAIQGGSDNTATTMALAIYFILAYPSMYKRLQAELEQVFPESISPLDRSLFHRVPLLDAVLNETLRLGSPFFLPRVVPAGGVSIDGNFIPGNMTVALAAYTQQISAENFFPDPLSFRPERWLPGGLGPDSVLNKAALFSFSCGPYMCVAKSFAMHEMRMCFSRLVLTFDMELPDGFDVKGFYDGLRNMRTIFLDLPLILKIKRREGRQVPLNL
ncbi:cytochrome P450 [Mycena floridula]|nr:cytochrome P450 [Mycena floridula]